MKVKRVVVDICEACLKGEGKECHTPSCIFWMHDSPREPLDEKLMEVIIEFEEE